MPLFGLSCRLTHHYSHLQSQVRLSASFSVYVPSHKRLILFHTFSTTQLSALSHLENSSSVYRHGRRERGLVWSRRLSLCSGCPSSQHRTRALNKLVIIRSTAVAAVIVKMEFQPTSLSWGRAGKEWCQESVEAISQPWINYFGNTRTCFLTESEMRGLWPPSCLYFKYGAGTRRW